MAEINFWKGNYNSKAVWRSTDAGYHADLKTFAGSVVYFTSIVNEFVYQLIMGPHANDNQLDDEKYREAKSKSGAIGGTIIHGCLSQ